MNGYERLTYRQLGEKLNISPDAARMKAKRQAKKGRWFIIQGNHPNDPVHVECPLEDLLFAAPRETSSQEPRPRLETDTVSCRLVEALDKERARVAELTALLLTEKEARRTDAAEIAAAEARELGTCAELRAAQASIAWLQNELERARQPWWKRRRG